MAIWSVLETQQSWPEDELSEWLTKARDNAKRDAP